MRDINVRLLELAKELMIMEYNDKKTQDHNRWLIESERAWLTSRTKLQHPPFPPFPTQDQILERAKTLLGFVHSTEELDSKPLENTMQPTVQQQPDCTTTTTSTITAECTTATTATMSTTDSQCTTETQTTIQDQPENTPDKEYLRDSVPGMRDFDLPENLLAYSRIKIANNLEDKTPGSAKVITNLIETLKRGRK